MAYDVGIILAHGLVNEDGKWRLSDLTRERTNLGIEYYKTGKIRNLLMSGGHKDVGQKYGISLAEAMKKYAIKQGVPESVIFKEEISLETVGQLIFDKIGVIEPKQWKNIIIITHSWHMPRVKKEAKFIFGQDYNLGYGVTSNSKIIGDSFEKELASYEVFLENFRGIERGDSEAILNRLLEKHPWYNQNPEWFRKKLNKLIEKI